MFNTIPQARHDEIITRLKGKYDDMKVSRESSNVTINDLKFKLRHFKDEEVLRLNKELIAKDLKIAVLEKEQEMTRKLIEVSSDIIDIKDLVATLIEKLPEVKLNNITVASKVE